MEFIRKNIVSLLTAGLLLSITANFLLLVICLHQQAIINYDNNIQIVEFQKPETTNKIHNIRWQIKENQR